MVQVNFSSRLRSHEVVQEFKSTAHGQSNVLEPPLIRAARRIANDNRQNVQTDMVKIGSSQCAANDVSAIAAAQVDDQGRLTLENDGPIDRSHPRKVFQSGSSPTFFGQNAPWERYPELTFYLPFVCHQAPTEISGHHLGRRKKLLTGRSCVS